MGRKKKKSMKPWCWYCNRDFEDGKILIQHQRAKHFKCPVCHKKLYTGPGLAIHCMQVHRETIKEIPNALPNRTNPEVEIYGTEGIPEEDVKARASGKDIEEPDAKKAKSEETPEPQPSTQQPASYPTAAQNPGFWPRGGPLPFPPRPGQPGPGLQVPPAPFGTPPMPARFPFPNMPPPNPNMPPPIRTPPATTSNSTIAPNRPLFPSASQVSKPATITSGPVGTDFKPISNAKTFEAKPVMNDGNASSDVSTTTVAKPPPPVNPTGAASRLVHPEEDISLEERRAAKYLAKIAPAPSYSGASAVHTAPPYSYGAVPLPSSQISHSTQISGVPKY